MHKRVIGTDGSIIGNVQYDMSNPTISTYTPSTSTAGASLHPSPATAIPFSTSTPGVHLQAQPAASVPPFTSNLEAHQQSSPLPAVAQSTSTPDAPLQATPQWDDEMEIEEDDTKLYCICRKIWDKQTWMIGCEGGCEDWFHGPCVDINETTGNYIAKYICKLTENLR